MILLPVAAKQGVLKANDRDCFVVEPSDSGDSQLKFWLARGPNAIHHAHAELQQRKYEARVRYFQKIMWSAA